MLKRLYILVTLLWCVICSYAQFITVENRVDTTSILIGEQVRMHAKVSCPKGAKVVFPEFREGYVTEGVEMLDALKIDTVELNEGKRWELSREYIITSFDSAVYTIPRLEVSVNGKQYASRDEIGFKVNTVEVDLQHPDDLKPLKAPVDGVFAWSPRLLLFGLLAWIFALIAVATAVKYVTYKPKKKKIKITPPTPPQEVAIEALNRLRQGLQEGLDFTQMGQYAEAETSQKAYFMALTDVLRQYVAERFAFNAREMTTFEIIDRLRNIGDTAALEELHNILSTADLVKFAKYEATMTESDRALLQAAEYVRNTQLTDAASKSPKEKVIVEGEAAQRRYKMLLGTVITLASLCCIADISYLIYQLWLNFS